MGSFTVLRDVGNTLKKLLKDISEFGGDENRIVFDSPAEMDPVTDTRLSIFLFQVLPNPYLRNIGPKPVALDKIEPPPLVLDLMYMMTPYAQEKSTELMVIEKVMQKLYDNSVLRDAMLEGSLRQDGNNELRVTMHSPSLDDINKLWGIFPEKSFKLSAFYLVTPVKVPSARTIDVKRVTQKDLREYYIEK